MKKLIYFAVAIIGLFLISGAVVNQHTNAAGSNVLILFDASGSVLESFAGTPRINAAKSAVADFVAGLDPAVSLGLRPYAHIKKTAKSEACAVTELLQPFTTNHSLITNKVNALQAVGSYTPTAYTLQQAAKDFVSGQDNTLILITDGKETCGGDPAAAAKALCEAGIGVKSYVIGLDVDAAARTELNNVAIAGCGEYFDAKDSASLARSLASITERGIDKMNTNVVAQYTRVRGGNGFDAAVPISLGTFQLDHHQRNRDVDYFVMQIEPNTKYKIKIQNPANGVSYDSSTNTFREAPYNMPFMVSRSIVTIRRPDRSELKNVYGWEGAYAIHEGTFTTEDYSSVYLTIGGDLDVPTHKDTVFTISRADGSSPSVSPIVSGNTNSGNTDTLGADTSGGGNITPKTDEAPGLPKQTWIIIIVGGVLLLAAIVAVIVLLKKRKSTAIPPAVPPPQTSQ